MELRRRRRKNKDAARRCALMLTGALLIAALVLAGMAISSKIREAKYRALSREELSYAMQRGEEAEAQIADASTQSRLELAKAAVSIVGKVNYFWGGKSSAVGIDPEWGEIREITSSGSESSGSMKPYGLDCSGYVSWAFIQLGYEPGEMEALVGHGTWNQWDKTSDIGWDKLRVGDFAFMNRYPTDKGNHIGICVGFLENGEPVFAHCSSGFDNVVVTTAGDAFHHARRPSIFEQ